MKTPELQLVQSDLIKSIGVDTLLRAIAMEGDIKMSPLAIKTIYGSFSDYAVTDKPKLMEMFRNYDFLLAYQNPKVLKLPSVVRRESMTERFVTKEYSSGEVIITSILVTLKNLRGLVRLSHKYLGFHPDFFAFAIKFGEFAKKVEKIVEDGVKVPSKKATEYAKESIDLAVESYSIIADTSNYSKELDIQKLDISLLSAYGTALLHTWLFCEPICADEDGVVGPVNYIAAATLLGYAVKRILEDNVKAEDLFEELSEKEEYKPFFSDISKEVVRGADFVENFKEEEEQATRKSMTVRQMLEEN